MKRRFMAILMAGGMVLGMSSCGNSSDSNAVPLVEPESIVEPAGALDSVLVGEPDDVLGTGTNFGEAESDNMPHPELVAAEMLNRLGLDESLHLDEYFTPQELVGMMSAGEITMAEIECCVATGNLDYGEYEEVLRLMGAEPGAEIASGQNTDQTENKIEGNGSVGSIDTLSLLTTHVVEFEDRDGYTIRETCQLSPIFTEEDMETAYALWEALGNDVASFPSEESVYNKTYLIRQARDDASCNKLEYILGTYMVENLTDGFQITPDNPRTYSARLAAKQVSVFDEEHDGTAADFFNWRYVIVVTYSNSTAYYDKEDAVNPGIMLGIAKMKSDTWGPVHFVIALPNGATPNRPDGYRYDKIQLQFGSLASPYSDSDTFGLTYFEQ